MPDDRPELRAAPGARPRTFMRKASLAAELDISESSVDDYVRRGLLPPPCRVGGAVLFHWPSVEAHLLAMRAGSVESDPYLAALER